MGNIDFGNNFEDKDNYSELFILNKEIQLIDDMNIHGSLKEKLKEDKINDYYEMKKRSRYLQEVNKENSEILLSFFLKIKEITFIDIGNIRPKNFPKFLSYVDTINRFFSINHEQITEKLPYLDVSQKCSHVMSTLIDLKDEAIRAVDKNEIYYSSINSLFECCSILSNIYFNILNNKELYCDLFPFTYEIPELFYNNIKENVESIVFKPE